MPVIAPDSDVPLRRAPVAIIDWETTWEDDGTQHPVCVAVVHCELGVKDSERIAFTSLIKPKVSIRPEAEKIHGISDASVRNSPSIEDIADRFDGLLDGRVLGSYNIPFDVPIMQRYVDVPFGTLDPLVWAKVVDRRAGKKNLTAVAGRRGMTFEAHDAVADAMTTARLMPMLLAELRTQKGFDVECLDSIAGIWEYTKLQAVAWDDWFYDWSKKQGRDVNVSWRRLLGLEDRQQRFA